MKARSRRPPTFLCLASSSVLLVGLVLPACGADTEGVFQSSSNTNTGGSNGSNSSSSGDGGSTVSSSQSSSSSGNGQGGGLSSSTSSSGQGGGLASSTSSSGSSSSSGQTSSSSSSSSGSGMPEDCLDGLDNDLDGAIDCADSDCTTGFTCTDEAPTGWTSVALEQGIGAPPAPMVCDSGAMSEVLFTGPAGPAECTACTCGTLAGTTCSGPQLFCFPGSQGCNSGQQDWTGNFANGNCAKPDIGFSITMSCRLGNAASVNQPGSCPPSTSDFPNKDKWAGWAQSCDVKTHNGGCAAGTVCAPKPGPTQSLCIRQDGQQMCPAGWKTVDAYVDGTDDRSCGSCACAANATCTGGTYQVFDTNNCDPNNGNPVTVNDATCRNVSGQIDFGTWSVQKNPPTAGGSCTPSGGQPQGAMQPKGPVTFCCK